MPPRSSLSVVVVVDPSVSRSIKPRLPDVRLSVAGGVVFESSVAVGGILVPGMVFRDTGGLLGCLGLAVTFGIELLAEVLFGLGLGGLFSLGTVFLVAGWVELGSGSGLFDFGSIICIQN